MSACDRALRRRRARAWCVLLWLIAATLPAGAADEPLNFADPVKQARYNELLHELRCLVCQNQSLADSHADLAQDLRNEVYRMVDAGADSTKVIDFMVARYGNFVRYRPPFNAATALLWAAPLALVGLGVVVIIRRSARPAPAVKPLSADERARLAALAQRDSDDP